MAVSLVWTCRYQTRCPRPHHHGRHRDDLLGRHFIGSTGFRLFVDTRAEVILASERISEGDDRLAQEMCVQEIGDFNESVGLGIAGGPALLLTKQASRPNEVIRGQLRRIVISVASPMPLLPPVATTLLPFSPRSMAVSARMLRPASSREPAA